MLTNTTRTLLALAGAAALAALYTRPGPLPADPPVMREGGSYVARDGSLVRVALDRGEHMQWRWLTSGMYLVDNQGRATAGGDPHPKDLVRELGAP